MNNLTDWSLAKKIKSSNRQGMIVGIAIAGLVILAIVGIVLKFMWLKKHFGCCGCGCDEDIFDDEFLDDDDDDCCVASDKDFA